MTRDYLIERNTTVLVGEVATRARFRGLEAVEVERLRTKGFVPRAGVLRVGVGVVVSDVDALLDAQLYEYGIR